VIGAARRAIVVADVTKFRQRLPALPIFGQPLQLYGAIYVLKLCVMDHCGYASSCPHEAFDVSGVQRLLSMQDGISLSAVNTAFGLELSISKSRSAWERCLTTTHFGASREEHLDCFGRIPFQSYLKGMMNTKATKYRFWSSKRFGTRLIIALTAAMLTVCTRVQELRAGLRSLPGYCSTPIAGSPGSG
jgi:hypothetical protein